MSQPEVGRLIAQTIGVRARPAVVATVHSRTEGNPFYVGELARLLRSDGKLEPAGAAGHDAVPAGVRDVVRRRLVRLPERTNELLALAAVIGREFELALLAGASERGERDAFDVLEAAHAAGVIIESRGIVGHFRFSHALIRDTIYSGLSPLRRATLHARVAVALELRHGPDRSHLPELAWHFFHAAAVTGPERGLAYLLDAANAAQASLASEQAEDDLRRALSLIALLPVGARLKRELQIQNRLIGLLMMTRGHGTPELVARCDRSRQLCQEIGESDDMTAVTHQPGQRPLLSRRTECPGRVCRTDTHNRRAAIKPDVVDTRAPLCRNRANAHRPVGIRPG